MSREHIQRVIQGKTLSASALRYIHYLHAVSLAALRAAGHQRTIIETPPRPKTRNTTQLQRLLTLGGSITPTRSRKARGISTVPGTPGNSIVISRWRSEERR